MLKSICIIVLVACVGTLIYSIINAIVTVKRNKATDEASREIFLAKMRQASQNNNTTCEKPVWTKQPFSTIEPNKPKPLNYDEYEDDTDFEIAEGKHLKDFFKAD